jgi:hypothetical protein
MTRFILRGDTVVVPLSDWEALLATADPDVLRELRYCAGAPGAAFAPTCQLGRAQRRAIAAKLLQPAASRPGHLEPTARGYAVLAALEAGDNR